MSPAQIVNISKYFDFVDYGGLRILTFSLKIKWITFLLVTLHYTLIYNQTRKKLGSWIPRNICILDHFEEHFCSLNAFDQIEIVFNIAYIHHLYFLCMYIIIFGPYINENYEGMCVSHNSGSEESRSVIY